MTLTNSELAALFESLGGGSLNANGWAFGCEFGFWQRSLGVEPLGLLRWASIAPNDLLRGLDSGFAGVDDIADIEAREHTGSDWGITQRKYGMYLDHSGMNRAEIPRKQAISRVARGLGRLRERLIEDLTTGEKLFVYRTYDHTLDDGVQAALAAAVGAFGGATLCYVRHADTRHPAFTAERQSAHLIVGYIDHFAPGDGRFNYNPDGWEAVCRAALGAWK